MFKLSISNPKTIARTALLGLGLVASLLCAHQARADGVIGQYSNRGALCYHNGNTNFIAVTSPEFSSAEITLNTSGPLTFGVGGTFGGGFNMQAVGYSATLYRWNGQAWAAVAYNTWRHAIFGDKFQPAVGWYLSDMSGDPNDGTSWFQTGPGYYAVQMNYYWWANSVVRDGWTSEFISSYDGQPWCYFPS